MRYPILIVSLLLLTFQSSYGRKGDWFISKESGVRFPIPHKWLKGGLNDASPIKLILYNPEGARIVLAKEHLDSKASEKALTKASIRYLKKKKFKILSQNKVIVMGKPTGTLIKARNKYYSLTMVHIIHRSNGIVLTFSCNPKQITANGNLKKTICKNRETEFGYLISRLILF